MLQPQADPNFVPSIISKLFLKITMIIIKPS